MRFKPTSNDYPRYHAAQKIDISIEPAQRYLQKKKKKASTIKILSAACSGGDPLPLFSFVAVPIYVLNVKSS